jgi:3-dehydroquinate dehydratase
MKRFPPLHASTRRASAPHAREEFRHHSAFGEIVKGRIRGRGLDSNPLGLLAAVSASTPAQS